MASFRGKPLTHESAESIFLGSLKDSGGDLDWSWRVVAGQNAAYDQFPCQYQVGRALHSKAPPLQGCGLATMPTQEVGIVSQATEASERAVEAEDLKTFPLAFRSSSTGASRPKRCGTTLCSRSRR